MRRGGGSGVAFLSSNGLYNLVRNSQWLVSIVRSIHKYLGEAKKTRT